MNIKLAILISSALTILTPTISFANGEQIDCPTTALVNAVHLDIAEPWQSQTWAAATMTEKFGTKYTWSFVVLGIIATNADEALYKGNAAVKALAYTGVETSFCVYQGKFQEHDIIGFAEPISEKAQFSELARNIPHHVTKS